MECPECEGKTKVRDTRSFAGAVYRKRVCKECGFSFYTEELETTDTRLLKDMWKFQRQKNREAKKKILKNNS